MTRFVDFVDNQVWPGVGRDSKRELVSRWKRKASCAQRYEHGGGSRGVDRGLSLAHEIAFEA